MKDFLETQDIAERLGIAVRQVQRLARQGRIPHVRDGRKIRVPRVAWEQFVAEQADAAMAGMKEAPPDTVSPR